MGSASLPELGFIPKTPLSGQRRRSVSDAVLAVSLTECFFTTHTPCRQSWRGRRIAPLNPGVGTGLPRSILAWAQDCPTQSWHGHRKTLEAQCCTALRPQTRRPDCAENTGSASVHTDALPDSPPGFPASNLASNAKEMGKIKLFPTEYSSKQSSDPVVPLVPCMGIFLGPSKSGKTVALISLILEQYRGVFERIYVFSPSVNRRRLDPRQEVH